MVETISLSRVDIGEPHLALLPCDLVAWLLRQLFTLSARCLIAFLSVRAHNLPYPWTMLGD